MPTFASRPSLEATQAVGAILLHQFARERFVDAGIDEAYIREAEDRQQLDALASTLILEEDQTSDANTTTNSSFEKHNNRSEHSNGNELARQTGPNNLPADNSFNQSGCLSETSNASFQTTAVNRTTVGDVTNDTCHQHDAPNGELFHSVAESSTNGTPQRMDRTIYHSMNVSNPPQVSHNSPFERLQASPSFASYGRELRRIAEEFEKSRLREDVKQRAGRVNLHEITKDKFVELLEELFQGKITRERIVILFFFCTDVALRAALSAQELVVKLLGWSFSFIVNTVCSFVYRLGGWDKVLFYNFVFYQLPSLMVTGCALMAMLWFGINIRKSLRD